MQGFLTLIPILETWTIGLGECENLRFTVQEIWDSDNIHYAVAPKDVCGSRSYPV